MPEQLIFELADAEPPSFANFLAGRNAEAIALLARAARGEAAETGILLWGAPGAGKTHLLRATVALASVQGRTALYCASPAEAPVAPPSVWSLVAIDAVDTADAVAQGRLFTLFNALAATGGQMIAAAAIPAAQLSVREDLRTRLGWGLVYEIVPLADADKPAALAAYARERGFDLPEEVIGYLLAHGRRDMGSLVSTLAALDRHSLAVKRPVTLPLLREWLQREMRLR